MQPAGPGRRRGLGLELKLTRTSRRFLSRSLTSPRASFPESLQPLPVIQLQNRARAAAAAVATDGAEVGRPTVFLHGQNSLWGNP